MRSETSVFSHSVGSLVYLAVFSATSCGVGEAVIEFTDDQPDTVAAFDAGVALDAGGGRDASVAFDAGPAFDAGTPVDAGSRSVMLALSWTPVSWRMLELTLATRARASTRAHPMRVPSLGRSWCV